MLESRFKNPADYLADEDEAAELRRTQRNKRLWGSVIFGTILAAAWTFKVKEGIDEK